MTQISETIGRSAVLAAASNYQSVSEALLELVDNAFDKRRGRFLNIDIRVDRSRDYLEVMDYGGEGMNADSLQEWIRWGEGQEHSASDIGQYRIGGKLAAVYLAEDLEITCRKSGEDEIWRFHDRHWGSRTTALDASPIVLIRPSSIRWSGEMPREKVGFTRVILRGLKDHRYEIGILQQRLATTYKALIAGNMCRIRIGGAEVEAWEVPWSSSIPIREIGPQRISQGVSISGRVGAIDRDRLPQARGIRIEAGIRTEFNGRMITEGEQFGHTLSGKGNLQRTYGEILISGGGLKPNQLKNGWPRDSREWRAIHDYVHEEMQSIVATLNRISESQPVTRDERKRANNAGRRLADALKRLQILSSNRYQNPLNAYGMALGEGGRRPPSQRERQAPVQKEQKEPRQRNPVQNPTEPPEDAVGRLIRNVNRMPRVDYDQLGDQTPRTQWRDEDDGTRTIVINKDYPLYESLGVNEDYVFESLVSHLVQEEVTSVDEATKMFDQLVWLDREAQVTG